jgi:drug/metabolite transporter (DMT)-like permease
MNNADIYGALAALGSAFSLALGFIIWDAVWNKSHGSAFSLNLVKCNAASVVFLILGFSLGFVNDVNWNYSDIGYLILSGFIGIIVGDLCWLEALSRLGPIPVLVIDTFKPFFAALFGWVFFEEPIQNIAYAGLFLTAIGILIVGIDHERSMKKREENEIEIMQQNVAVDDDVDSNRCVEDLDEKDQFPSANEKLTDISAKSNTKKETNTKFRGRGYGYVLAVANVLLDTYGSVLTKQHGSSFKNLAINLIRFGSSGAVMLLIVLVMKFVRREKEDHNPWFKLPDMSLTSWLKIMTGILFVTFICPSLSNYALFQVSLYIALSMGSTTPLFGFLLELILGRQPSLRGFLGAILSVGGVIVLATFGLGESKSTR